MYKTLACISAVAILISAGGYAEDSQKESKDSGSTEQSVASCNCGHKGKKGKGHKDGDRLAHCGDDKHTHDEDDQGSETNLSCNKC